MCLIESKYHASNKVENDSIPHDDLEKNSQRLFEAVFILSKS